MDSYIKHAIDSGLLTIEEAKKLQWNRKRIEGILKTRSRRDLQTNNRILENKFAPLIDEQENHTKADAQFEIINASGIEKIKEFRDEGKEFDVIHCDPPYGTLHQGMTGMKGISSFKIYKDDMRIYNEFLKNVSNSGILKRGGLILWWLDLRNYNRTVSHFLNHGISLRSVPLVWVKTDNMGMNTRYDMRNLTEYMLYGFDTAEGIVEIQRGRGNVIGAPRNRESGIFPSEKNEKVIYYVLENLIERKDGLSIFDPCCGSGSALRAAKRFGFQSGIGVEINKKFADSARQLL